MLRKERERDRFSTSSEISCWVGKALAFHLNLKISFHFSALSKTFPADNCPDVVRADPNRGGGARKKNLRRTQEESQNTNSLSFLASDQSLEAIDDSFSRKASSWKLRESLSERSREERERDLEFRKEIFVNLEREFEEGGRFPSLFYSVDLELKESFKKERNMELNPSCIQKKRCLIAILKLAISSFVFKLCPTSYCIDHFPYMYIE